MTFLPIVLCECACALQLLTFAQLTLPSRRWSGLIRSASTPKTSSSRTAWDGGRRPEVESVRRQLLFPFATGNWQLRHEFSEAWGNLSMLEWGAHHNGGSPTPLIDESPAGYSLARCAPAEPPSASPADIHNGPELTGCTAQFDSRFVTDPNSAGATSERPVTFLEAMRSGVLIVADHRVDIRPSPRLGAK